MPQTLCGIEEFITFEYLSRAFFSSIHSLMCEFFVTGSYHGINPFCLTRDFRRNDIKALYFIKERFQHLFVPSTSSIVYASKVNDDSLHCAIHVGKRSVNVRGTILIEVA